MVNESVFLLKSGIINHEIADIKKNFWSVIREYAGPRTVNREWVRVYCICIIYTLQNVDMNVIFWESC